MGDGGRGGGFWQEVDYAGIAKSEAFRRYLRKAAELQRVDLTHLTREEKVPTCPSASALLPWLLLLLVVLVVVVGWFRRHVS
mgnify:CR=1 FL=1